MEEFLASWVFANLFDGDSDIVVGDGVDDGLDVDPAPLWIHPDHDPQVLSGEVQQNLAKLVNPGTN